MDDRKKRLLYRATHRGMKETDVLIGGFALQKVSGMNDRDVAAFEHLLEQNDNDLMAWILERKAVPVEQLADMVDRLISYRKTL